MLVVPLTTKRPQQRSPEAPGLPPFPEGVSRLPRFLLLQGNAHESVCLWPFHLHGRKHQGDVVEVEKWPCPLFGSTRHFSAVYYLEAYSVQFVSPANEPRNVFNCKELSQN